jgi:tRNA (uracil-5-)-methyltransferase TRM9
MDFYKEAADDFSRTRTTIWPGVLQFLRSIQPNVTILDAGCGNGKNMMKTSHNFIGLDMCEELLKIVRTKATKQNKTNILDLILGSVTNLPFENQQFDGVMSIAVVHHIKSFSDRIKAFEELIRVCKKGGQVLITVWQMENNPTYLDGLDEIDKNSATDEIDKNSATDEIDKNSATDEIPPYLGDKLIRWKHQDIKRGLTIGQMYRFYHFYSEDEVKYMISYCENKFNIKGSYYEEKLNYYIRFDC